MNRTVRIIIGCIGIAISLFVLINAISRKRRMDQMNDMFRDMPSSTSYKPNSSSSTESVKTTKSWLYDAGEFHNGLAPFKAGDKWGYINKEGKKIVAAQYSSAYDFSEGLALVCKDDKWGFLNPQGKVAIPLTYYAAGSFHDGLARVENERGAGYINASGKLVIPFNYYGAGNFSNGLSVVRKDGNYGVLNTKGVFTAFRNADKYGDIDPFYDGMALVSVTRDRTSYGAPMNYSYGFINTSGKEIIPLEYHFAEEFSEGLAAYNDESINRYGFLDKTGNIAIEPKFQDLRSPFSEGLCAAKMNDKFGFVDHKGNMVIDFKYDLTMPFKNGIARFSINDKWGFMDKQGKEIIPAKYDDANEFGEGLALVEENGNWIYIDLKGNMIIDKEKE